MSKSIPCQEVESTGEKFNLKQYLDARKKAWKNLYQIHCSIEKNYQHLNEEKIHTKINQIFGSQVKFWHPHKVRFGINTKCSFRDISDKSIFLKKQDHYFIDLGPVFDSHEADVGQTFCIGDQSFINPAQEIFNALELLWLEQKITGKELYDKAHLMARAKGLLLNDKMKGHRLGDFPHALIHRGGLKDFNQHPQEILWVLEVHLLDQKNNRGYFFEDILGAPKLRLLKTHSP